LETIDFKKIFSDANYGLLLMKIDEEDYLNLDEKEYLYYR